MDSKNDMKILELQKAIAEKEAAIPQGRISTRTTCVLRLDGEAYNLHVLQEDGLRLLWCRLKALENADRQYMEAFDQQPLEICGYPIGDWLEDIGARLRQLRAQADMRRLRQLKDALSGYMSQDMKTQQALAAMEEELGGIGRTPIGDAQTGRR